MKFKTVQIVKIGSQALFREKERIDINKINDLGQDVKNLRDHKGVMSVLVTSGAISLGKMARSMYDVADDVIGARVAASIGQLQLMELYKLSIGEEVAQILPTHHSMLNAENQRKFEEMMRALINGGVFPIVNYNDTADDYEITHIIDFSDNDKLTQTLALMLKVDRVIILSNVDGLLDGDERLIERVTLKDDFEKLRGFCGRKSSKGTGGMLSKINIAETLLKNGITMILGNSKYSLQDIIDGKVPRTVFS